MTKSLILAAKALFAAGIVWFLFARGYLDLADLGEIARRPWTVIVPGILVFLTLPLMTWRWSILLRSQGVTVPFMGAFRVTVAGMLANTFVLNSESTRSTNRSPMASRSQRRASLMRSLRG